ncbi:MAG: FHA domain-containing protein [Holophagaceae bacterium]|nr:FHA domain-containing protein [Holophagaceae bacterium]
MARLRIPHPPEGVPAHIDLPAEGATLGREVDNSIRLAVSSVSRHHATLAFQGGAWWVEDRGSANGTFVNDQAVQRALLRPGDRLRLGDLTLVLEDTPPPPAPRRRRGACLLGCLGVLVALGVGTWASWTWIEGQVRALLPRPAATAPTTAPLRQAQAVLSPPRVVTPSGADQPSVTVLKRLPRPLPRGLEALTIAAVGGEGSHRLDQPVVLEFPYDPARLAEGVNPDERLALAHLDEGTGRWILAAAQVDPARRVLRTRTRHLSVWSTVYITRGFHVHRSRRFSVVFSPGEPIVFGKVKGRAGQVDAWDFATDLGRTLDGALERYERAGFRPPEGDSGEDGRIWAFLGHATEDWLGQEAAESQWVAFSGNLLFPANYDTPRQAEHDAAHELFHKIQNRDLNLVSMDRRRWWIEATADYAAARIALQQGGTDTTMGERIRPRYLEKSITFNISRDDGSQPHSFHEYSTSHFLDYLVKQGADFRAMYEAVVNPSLGDLLDALDPMDKYLRRTFGASRGLDAFYRDFARFYVLDPASPMPALPKGFFEEVPSGRLQLAAGQRQGQLQATVEGPHAAQVLAIRAEALPGRPTRRLQLTQEPGTGTGLITGVYRVKAGAKVALASQQPLGMLGAKPLVADLAADEGLVLIACNGTGTTRPLGVRVQDLSPEPARPAAPPPAAGGVRRLLRVTAFGWASWDRVAQWNGVAWGSRWMEWGTHGEDIAVPDSGSFSITRWAGGYDLTLQGELTPTQVVSLRIQGRRAVPGDIQETWEVVIRGLPVVPGDPTLYQAMATPQASVVPKDVARFIAKATYERTFPNGERQTLAGVNWTHRTGPWATLPDSPNAQCAYVSVKTQRVNARNEPVR